MEQDMTKDELKLALHKAFDLGSRYWQQADSEYSSQWKKADATRAQLDQLIEDTAKQAHSAPVQPVAMPANWFAGMPEEYRKEAWRVATPPAQPAPVSLTDEQIDAIRFSIPTKAVTQRDFELARAIEAKLKEKNT
jgi:hypothetical protein